MTVSKFHGYNFSSDDYCVSVVCKSCRRLIKSAEQTLQKHLNLHHFFLTQSQTIEHHIQQKKLRVQSIAPGKKYVVYMPKK